MFLIIESIVHVYFLSIYHREFKKTYGAVSGPVANELPITSLDLAKNEEQIEDESKPKSMA